MDQWRGNKRGRGILAFIVFFLDLRFQIISCPSIGTIPVDLIPVVLRPRLIKGQEGLGLKELSYTESILIFWLVSN